MNDATMESITLWITPNRSCAPASVTRAANAVSQLFAIPGQNSTYVAMVGLCRTAGKRHVRIDFATLSALEGEANLSASAFTMSIDLATSNACQPDRGVIDVTVVVGDIGRLYAQLPMLEASALPAGQIYVHRFTRAECASCGKERPPVKCGRCLRAKYCSRDCQKADWRKHKSECYNPSPIAEDSTEDWSPMAWSHFIPLANEMARLSEM